MNVQIISTENNFAALEKEWGEVLENDYLSNNFMSFEWVRSWWCAYRPEASLRIITVRSSQGGLIGIAPLMILKDERDGVLCNCLKFIGDGSDETDHMSFVLHKDHMDAALAGILEVIRKEINWDILELNMLPSKSALRTVLQQWVTSNKFSTKTKYIEYAKYNFTGSFEDFFKNLQPRFRTKLRSSRKKLEQSFQVEFGLHDTDNNQENLERLFVNHTSRWSAKGQHGVFKEQPRRMEFYSLLTREFSKRGWLRFFYLKLDGEVIAQQYCFEYRKTIYILQEGFNSDYSRDNIGNILRSYVYEYCCENGIKSYDFLGYLSSHKKRWSNEYGKDLCIQIFRNDLKSQYIYLKPIVLFNSKKLLKKIIPAFALRNAKSFMARYKHSSGV